MTLKLRNFYEIGVRANEDPLVYVFENFLSDGEVDAMLLAAKPQLQKALVSADDAGVESPGRSGTNCWLAHSHNDVIAELSLRISEVVGIPLEYSESLQIIHYRESEEYAPHYDAWDPATERGRRCMARGGQRLVTCLLYLNDVTAGGSTSFPKLDMAVEAKKGRMVIFHNCHEGSNVRHPQTLHGGMPVLEGEKWACNLWFRESAYQDPDKVPVRRIEPSSPQKFKRII